MVVTNMKYAFPHAISCGKVIKKIVFITFPHDITCQEVVKIFVSRMSWCVDTHTHVCVCVLLACVCFWCVCVCGVCVCVCDVIKIFVCVCVCVCVWHLCVCVCTHTNVTITFLNIDLYMRGHLSFMLLACVQGGDRYSVCVCGDRHIFMTPVTPPPTGGGVTVTYFYIWVNPSQNFCRCRKNDKYHVWLVMLRVSDTSRPGNSQYRSPPQSRQQQNILWSFKMKWTDFLATLV